MKKTMIILLMCGVILGLNFSHFLSSTDSRTETTEESTDQNTADSLQEDDSDTTVSTIGGNALVAYFAYSENIGDTSDMSVDAITSASVRTTDNMEGNLQIMAQVIESSVDADVFHIIVQEPYDPEYDVMHDRAIDEIDNEEFPALTESVENLEQYDVVYLGMPVWSSSLPRPVATFLTENDLSGKTIVPFGINLGSGFGSMISEIEELCPDATLVDGFTISARTVNDEVREEFSQWLDELALN